MDEQYTLRLKNIEAVIDRWLPGKAEAKRESADAVKADSFWRQEVFPGLSDIDPALLHALTAPGRDLVSRGGKRWRPLLMVLVCEALGGGDTALPLVPLVEFSHNATLIHDDIEDNSDERRGKPAVHLIHGVDVAINSGSFLYFLAPACINSWAAGLGSKEGLSESAVELAKAEVYELWAGFMRKVHLGQAMDIHWHRSADAIPSVDEYYKMCGLKTGCLARFAAELGVLASDIASDAIGNAGLLVAGRMGSAAEKLGVGFQILDDVKNVSVGIAGKKRGDDIVEGKKSLPILLFLHRWPEKKEMVNRCFSEARAGGVSAPEVEELIEALASSGVLAEAEARAKAFIYEAREIFTISKPSIPWTAESRELLAGLADSIG
ncbi:MAG: polyprenyl synthetase family protein [Treponema sp.]|nr:polyprenyl synthetase family protein [Treponema sp.]